jgi:hypothetical protein
VTSIWDTIADPVAYERREEISNRNAILIAAWHFTPAVHKFRLATVEYGPFGARHWGVVCHLDAGMGLVAS